MIVDHSCVNYHFPKKEPFFKDYCRAYKIFTELEPTALTKHGDPFGCGLGQGSGINLTYFA